MKPEIKYIELKSNYSHNGPAWIGLVSFSKSGRTLYFDGKAFQRIGSDRMRGNYYDIESGDEYWISGVKNDLSDRHKFGNGKIAIEERILNEYLTRTKQSEIDDSKFSICSVIEEIPIGRINELENEKHDDNPDIKIDRRLMKPTEMSEAELEYFIEYFKEGSIEGRHLKGRKFSRNKMNELVKEKENRNNKTTAKSL